MSIRLLRHVDPILVGAVLLLVGFGILMIAGSTATSVQDAIHSPYVQRQFLWACVGLVVMIATMSVDYRNLRSLSRIFYFLSLLMLVLVLTAGTEAGGARRWLNFGPIGLQPAEFARILIAITLANQITAVRSEREAELLWSDFAWFALHVAVPAILVLMQPDMGTALVFFSVLFGELYIAGFSPWKLAGLIGAGLVTTVGAVMTHIHLAVDIPFLRPYMINRLTAFIDPMADPTGAGYQLKQSIIAIGSGQLTGVGLFRGAGGQLHFLPEQHTDFIFSALGEQMGFVGTCILLLLFLGLFLRMLAVCGGAADYYGAILSGGIVAMLFFRVVVNVGMAVGVMPVTGLPLPFVSYGGSAFLADMIAVGIVLGIGMRRHKIQF